MKREVRVEDSVGMVLAHDLTRIVPGEFKGRVFSRGHVIQPGDIETLLSIGKEHIYVLSPEEGEVHEDEAALRMANALSGEDLLRTDPHEGKITLKAARAGLFVVEPERLQRINLIGELALVTKRSNQPVRVGQPVAALRAIPLVIEEDRLRRFEKIAKEDGPLLRVIPFRPLRTGVVTTGSEVFKGRIEDRFGPTVERKLLPFDMAPMGQRIVDDRLSDIEGAIRDFIREGAELVLVTGGMSVDPDDRSPAAIRAVATEVVTYGMPILPGSMTMLAYAGETVLLGLPGCVIYDPETAFDWLLPRILAGLRPTREDIAALGHGGLM